MNDVTLQFIRADYLRVLAETSMTHEQVLAMTENTHDLTALPPGFEHLHLAQSPIGGQGVFTGRQLDKGDVIGPARIDNKRTQLGRYANHSPWPNTAFRLLSNGDLDSVALCAIPAGGEVLNNYRQGAYLWGAQFDPHEVAKTMRDWHQWRELIQQMENT